jgi:hypothetical protein
VGLPFRRFHNLAERRTLRPAQEVEDDRLLRPLPRFGAGLAAFFAFGCFLAVGFSAAALAFFFGLALLAPRLALRAPSEELVPLFPLLFFGDFWPGSAASVAATAAAVVSVMLSFSLLLSVV